MRFLRLVVVLLFCLPQVFAPLVHAHVGVDISPSALHLPGLESVFPSDGLDTPSVAERNGGLVVQAAKGVRQGYPLFSALSLPVSASEIPPVAPCVALQAGLLLPLPKGVPPTSVFPRAPPA